VSSSTKKKILSCVSGKAKSLGCKTSDGIDSLTDQEFEALIENEEYKPTLEFIKWLEEAEETE